MRTRLAAWAVRMLGAAGLLVLAGVLSPWPTPAAAATVVKITITDTKPGFSPTTALSVPVGTEVEWVNKGALAYGLTIDGNPFGLLVPGQTSSPYTPTKGTHKVQATSAQHAWTMTVTATSTTTSPSPAPTATSGGSTTSSPRPSTAASPPKVAPAPRTRAPARPPARAGAAPAPTPPPFFVGALPSTGTTVTKGSGPGVAPIVAPGQSASPSAAPQSASLGSPSALAGSSPRDVGLPAAVAAVVLVGVMAAQLRVVLATPRS